ncbi:MAG: hypothetical protein GY754_16605 [bacterium]|nr:hypothetical protein [bacterium]
MTPSVMIRIDDIKIILFDLHDAENPMVSRFRALSGKKILGFDNEDALGREIDSLREAGVSSKEVLILKQFKGRTFQQCPGSRNVICCNYYLINTCFDCLYNCTYCFLNSYLNTFGITQFINLERVVHEIRENLDLSRDIIYRVGTGEFTDSLMMDQVTGIAESIISGCADLPSVMVEFKTKSDNVDHLLNIPRKGNAVMAWTLNTEKSIAEYEEGAASLDRRLTAAVKAQNAGYYLAFHFDPVIMYDGFLEEYLALVDKLFETVDPEKTVWISMGGFRYAPGFKEIMRNKFPYEQLTTGEMFPGIDGKFRYLKSMRVNAYQHIINRIELHTAPCSKKPFLYLCMESSEVWHSLFSVNYHTSDDLEQAMSVHLRDVFGIGVAK